MSARRDLSRRLFLKSGLVATAGFGLAFHLPEIACRATAIAEPFAPNALLSIEPSGAVRIVVPRSEMGQGVRTSLPMIVAEELEADWTRIEVVQAIAGPPFRSLRTSGSGSIYGGWRALRTVGATAREMLLTAAATEWNVARTECRAENSTVIHVPTGRRATYGDLATAAAKVPVPKPEDVPLKDPKAFRIVGTRVRRVDGPAIVAGTAVYGMDVRVPGMKTAVIARCPVLGGSLETFDAARTRKITGVRDVVRVSTGIAVVADTTWAAIRGREALDVSWDEGPNRAFDSTAYAAELEAAARRAGVVTRREGEGAAALAKGARSIEALYTYPYQVHAPVEPANCVADVRKDSCEIWAPTQAPDTIREQVAARFGIPPERVRVHVTLLGGAFGRRLGIDYALEAAETSKAIGAPAHLVWTREDDTRNGFFQPSSAHLLRGAIDASGNPVAWAHTKASFPHSAFGAPSAAELQSSEYLRDSAWGAYDVPYSIPNIETSYVPVASPVPTGPWRSVYSPSCTFARESFVDEMAHAAGRDPLAFRLALLAKDRTVRAGELTLDQGRLARVLELAAEKAGWDKPLPKGWGRGIAANIYDQDTFIAYVVEVSHEGGRVRVRRVVCAADPGVIVNPNGAEAQIEGGIMFGLSTALCGEITIRKGRVEQSSYADYPVMRIDEAPAIEIHLVASNAQPAGLGEPPVPPIAPALANAIFAATGRRMRHLPIRFEEPKR